MSEQDDVVQSSTETDASQDTPTSIHANVGKLPSLIQRYREVSDHDNLPREFHTACAIAYAGLIVARKVVLRYEWWDVLPIIHPFLIADSGMGKSASIYLMRRLLKRIYPDFHVISKQATLAGIIGSIPQHNGQQSHPVLIEAGEMTTLINKADYLADVVPGLCELVDNVSYDKTLRGERTRIDGLQVCLVMGSNEHQLRLLAPRTFVDGGLASRLFWVSGTREYRRVSRFDHSDLSVDKAQTALLAESNEVAKMHGVMSISDPAYDWFDAWQEQNRYADPLDSTMKGYTARRHITILRLAMVSALSSARMTVELGDMEWGWALVQEHEPHAHDIIRSILSTDEGRRQGEVLRYLQLKGDEGASVHELSARFIGPFGGLRVFSQTMDGLQHSHRVKQVSQRFYLCGGKLAIY